MPEPVSPPSAPLAVDVRGLTKRFGTQTVVDHIDIQVPAGLIYGFLGPNGSGKTTTLRMLCGLLTPDGGEGSCLGLDIRTDAARIKNQIGYMTQRFSYYDDLTVTENLDFVARAYQVPDRRKAVAAVMKDLDLTPRRDVMAGHLSGGWKQRLALAACLIHDPKLLLLDEPTAGVDPEARRSFWNEIHSIAARGVTVLVTTHYMDEVERCHSITYIAEGNVVTTGTPREIIGQSRLKAAALAGPDLEDAAQALRALPGIASVAALGGRLVVAARVQTVLDDALAPYRARGYEVEAVAPSFEDVFVELIHVADEQRAAKRAGVTS
ncbi:ABC transporter ATP-binding protein [Govanella unica]|uniref:ABC transporter ATP-binding protein n=1 Tax=Govanella unica TaxID=2975056 RepID=A0A9X3Z811_9PROT|nr:ABC transporter ATP-binding protein [Govania unica]MDA5194850.1 ABC transporter ATP-binding protein [Govania unica]